MYSRIQQQDLQSKWVMIIIFLFENNINVKIFFCEDFKFAINISYPLRLHDNWVPRNLTVKTILRDHHHHEIK